MSATSSRSRSWTPGSSRRRMASVMIRAIARISSGPKPRVVVAGVPRRIPEAVFGGSGSNGIAFLLTVMPTSSRSASASLPVTPSGVTSTSIRWLSVPPETIRAPRSARASASTAAFSTVRRWSRRNGSPAASWKLTALPAMTCISGPPWTPGKTALSIWAARVVLTLGKSARSTASGRSVRLKMRPPRPPRRVLCVVVVTMSACGNGLGWTPAATRPAMWAMSTNRSAPTPWAISAMRGKSRMRGYADAPATTIFGRTSFAMTARAS